VTVVGHINCRVTGSWGKVVKISRGKDGTPHPKGDVTPVHFGEDIGVILLSFCDEGRLATVGEAKAKRWASGTSPINTNSITGTPMQFRNG
jgi:hypothetical protein